jgi:cobalamin synthase
MSLGSLLIAARIVTAIFGGSAAAVPVPGDVVVSLFIAEQVRRTTQRRLEGMAGEVFGAIIEGTTAAVLLAVAALG